MRILVGGILILACVGCESSERHTPPAQGRVITPWDRDTFDLPVVLGLFNFQHNDPPSGACDGDKRPWVNTKTRRIFHCQAIEVRHEWTAGAELQHGTLWPAGDKP